MTLRNFTRNNITLIENEKAVTSEIELAKIFNKYFVDIVTKLGIKLLFLEKQRLRNRKSFCYH